MKQVLQYIGDLASILIIPLGLWGWFTITQQIHSSRIESESAAKDTYVIKAEYSETIKAINGTEQRLMDMEEQDRMTLQHLTDLVTPTRHENFSNKPNNN